MASLQKKYSQEKLKGQIYTPYYIVDKILDDVGFDNSQVLGKKILDPACGDGRFLEIIVKRILKFSEKENYKTNLEKIYGWDTDEEAIEIAKTKLNEVIKKHNIEINWNLKVQNSLYFYNEKYDFIVGNPPYIRIQHLEQEQRTYIQQNYSFCKSGSTDIYIAFYQLAYKLLAENGICGFITPNTFFNTETAKELRAFFIKNKNIKQITNYSAIQLFSNATTYSAITVFDKKESDSFLFQMANTEKTFEERKISFDEIKNQKFWQLSVEKSTIKKGQRLGDICNIHVGVTTLADKAYICKFIEEKEKTFVLLSRIGGEIEIEKEICKPIIKASLLKAGNEAITEYIFFPYKSESDKKTIIPELELEEKYPLAYKYLLSVKEILNKRDNGKPNKTAWYAFGRSQGLTTSFGKKILFSPMNKKPKFILSENKNATFYSGYCIKYDGDYEKLLEKLNSKEMENYIKISARDFRGGWKAYNKKIVQEFLIEK